MNLDRATIRTVRTIVQANRQWLSLGLAGLTLFGGLAAGDATVAAHAAPPAVPAIAQQPGTGHVAGGVPATAALLPAGAPDPSTQAWFTPTAAQLANARKIIEAGQGMGLPPRAWVIALATSLQESQLINYGDLGAANDHDSLGLFQQRPSSGWGTPQQLTDPTYAARAFYGVLETVPGYQSMPLTEAAQTVQVSAYPYAYAKWESMAAGLVQAYFNGGSAQG